LGCGQTYPYAVAKEESNGRTIFLKKPNGGTHLDDKVIDVEVLDPSGAYLKRLVVLVMVAVALFLISLYFFAPELRARALGALALTVVMAVVGVQVRRGDITRSVQTVTCGAWLVVTGSFIAVGSLRTPIIYAYPVIILCIGLLINFRMARRTTLATVAVILVIGVGEASGLISASVTPPPAIFGVIQITVCLMALLLARLVVTVYQARLRELKALGRNLTLHTQHLEESRLQLQQAQAVAKVGSWVMDLSTGEFTLTDETQRIFGMHQRPAGSTGSMLECTFPEDQAQLERALVDARNGTGFDFEQRIVVEDTVHWVRLKADVQRAADGTPYYAVGIAQDITDRKASESQIQNLAYFDVLTGLPNRRMLMNRLTHAMAVWARHQRTGALLFVDLDNFKVLNDTHGHFLGDMLLQQVAQRLSTCLRQGDTVARLGGDEFVVMLEELSEDTQAATNEARIVAEKILEVLVQPHQLGTYSHFSEASVGITLFGDLIEGIEEPLKRADMAMYQAKAAGRNTYRFFDPRIHQAIAERANLEKDLREGLEANQFRLVYQPQVNDQAQPTGAEALVRWQHPHRGQVSPADFIPLAEETGIILPLGQWVLETACHQLSAWAKQPAMAHLSVAVNVSPRQFHQSDFADQVLATLKRTGASPHRLKLELTEGMLVKNVEDVIAKMMRLKTIGVGFSLDDFGIGYSSLSYLKRLPLDQLKIDQSFVRDILMDPNDAAISKMVIVLAESLGLSVIAEGVETIEQRDTLAGQGCFTYQGYLFSRPIPAVELESFVQSRVNKQV
jgi:diguanylate cyclase (GGDEF)-like protein